MQEGIQRQLNETLVGAEMPVLVTGAGSEPGSLSGRTSCHRIVHFQATDDATTPGLITDVAIEKANPHSLLGRAIGGARLP